MRHPFFRDQEIMYPEGAKPGGVGHVPMGPRGRPSNVGIALFIEHGGHIRGNGQNSPTHEVGHDFTDKGLTEDFAQKAGLGPSF